MGGGGGANRFSCQTHNQVTLGCFWVGLLLLGLALGLWQNETSHWQISTIIVIVLICQGLWRHCRRAALIQKYQRDLRSVATLPLGQGHPPTGDHRGKPWGLAPQGNGDGTRPKGLGHPAEGQGVNCPPLSPSRLWSSSGGKVFPNLIQIWIASLGPIRNCQNPWQKPA